MTNTPFGAKEIEVHYEWVPHYCTQCNKIGHTVSTCKKNNHYKAASLKTKMAWRPKPIQHVSAVEKEVSAIEKEVVVSPNEVSGTNEKPLNAEAHKALSTHDGEQVDLHDGFKTVTSRSRSPNNRPDVSSYYS